MTRSFWGEKTIPQLVIEELAREFVSTSILLATSMSPRDDLLCDLANNLGITFFRGDESDVLSRALGSVAGTDAEYIVRVCADNPFLRAAFVVDLLAAVETGDEYVSFRTQTGVPSILTHFGLFAELISVETLRTIASEVDDPKYREHLTSFVLDHPNRFACRFLPIPDYLEDAGPMRLTVDTPEDFEVCQQIYATLATRCGSTFDANDLVLVVNDLPDSERRKMALQVAANQK